MRITEPTTMLTDYILAGMGIFFGRKLFLRGQEINQQAIRLWAVAFIAMAVGALAGGTSHGFANYLGDLGQTITWKLTVYAIGVASVCLASAAIHAHFTGLHTPGAPGRGGDQVPGLCLLDAQPRRFRVRHQRLRSDHALRLSARVLGADHP